MANKDRESVIEAAKARYKRAKAETDSATTGHELDASVVREARAWHALQQALSY